MALFRLILGLMVMSLSTPLRADVAQFYHIRTVDKLFADRTLRLFIAEPKVRFNHTALYLLDANVHFAKALEAVDDTKPLPLIVGIGYVGEARYFVPERTRDYTPKADGEAFAQGGGADAFLRVIREQVSPFVEADHAIQQRAFFGHSFGGLFGLYAMLQQPDLFDNYFLASPSLWWGKAQWLMSHWHSLPKPHFVQIMLGEYEAKPERDPKASPERVAKITARRAGITAEQLAAQFRAQGVNCPFSEIPHANHGAVIVPALRIALKAMQAEKVD
ncbi:alpha/beta hydrolase [Pasteurellaceae bacterium 20609_3]|nr:alpha/beta hydrolase [Spirabiliibacterium mucosae]